MAEAQQRSLVLASASIFRRRMLEAAGLAFSVVPADIDERAIERRLSSAGGSADPSGIAAALACAKAESVSRYKPEALVIGSDQVLALEGRIFSKPNSLDEARRQLSALRGRTHELHTAVALAEGGSVKWRRVEVARLGMRSFSDAFIERYLAAVGERACRTVGAYEVEGLGIQLFDRIEGDHFTIIGLPLLPLLEELRARGALPA